MKLVIISDTHGMYDRVTVPDGDVLIHAGDITRYGKAEEVVQFNRWLGTLPHPRKVIIAGNHDWVFQLWPKKAEALITNADYLRDSSVTIDGVKFYGSPWQPFFLNWAFNLQRGEELREKWALIPEDTDVLITHGPPFGTLDLIPGGMRVGCEELTQALGRLRLSVHAFGHVHSSYGIVEKDGIIYANASVCTERYSPTNPPHVFDI